nr:MAG TPA: hypothetical protein [Caudoviricetes sp.]
METSFLRDAIDRIVGLAAPYTMEANGHTFCSKALVEVKADEYAPTAYEVDTLDALVKLILTEGLTLGRRLYVRVDSARKVTVTTTYNNGELRNPYLRFPLYEAVSDVPGVTIGNLMSQERAIVELQSLYGATPDRDYLLDLLSRIDVNEGVSSVDNGVTQEVNVRTGAVLKQATPVRPIVQLQPYRTFLEVEQPVSDFLLRVSKEGEPTLFEADGGAWKLEAKRSIAAYLAEKLADQVESGCVVVLI